MRIPVGRAPISGARPSASPPPPARVKRTPTLTMFDRCDANAAGAERAYVRVDLLDGHELLFCAHHYAQHEAALQQARQGWPYNITDERWQITEQERERTEP